MIKIAICDNQVQHAQTLKTTIAAYSIKYNVDISLKLFLSSQELLQTDFPYQILLLTIDPDETIDGIKIGKIIRSKGCSALIIIISPYIKYSIQGYEVEAFRFLLRPVNETLVHSVLGDCLNKLNSDSGKIQIRTDHGIEFIDISSILYIESSMRRRSIYLVNEMCTTWHSLSEIKEMLPDRAFEYANRSHIIHLRHVRTIRNQFILMDNGAAIPLSRNNQTRFINKASQFIKQDF